MDLYIDRPASLLEGVYPLGSKQDGKRNIKTWLQKSPRPKPWPSSTNKAAKCTARMTIPFQPRATTKYLPRYFTPAFVKVVSIHPSPTSTIRAEETVRADLHTKNGTSTGPTGHPITNIKLPHVGGHEGIIALGPNCNTNPTQPELKIGALVGIRFSSRVCRRCEFCLAGTEQYCVRGTNRLHHEDGSFQEYIALDADYLTVLPEGVDERVMGPVLCAGLTAYKVLYSQCVRV